jgi:hypothetical protein
VKLTSAGAGEALVFWHAQSCSPNKHDNKHDNKHVSTFLACSMHAQTCLLLVLEVGIMVSGFQNCSLCVCWPSFAS